MLRRFRGSDGDVPRAAGFGGETEADELACMACMEVVSVSTAMRSASSRALTRSLVRLRGDGFVGGVAGAVCVERLGDLLGVAGSEKCALRVVAVVGFDFAAGLASTVASASGVAPPSNDFTALVTPEAEFFEQRLERDDVELRGRSRLQVEGQVEVVAPGRVVSRAGGFRRRRRCSRRLPLIFQSFFGASEVASAMTASSEPNSAMVRGGLGADAGDAGNVVDGVAHEREHVDDLLGRDALVPRSGDVNVLIGVDVEHLHAAHGVVGV